MSGGLEYRFRKKFLGARSRCNNPKDKRYRTYGGRGIKMCRKNFEDFKNDMRESFQKHVKEYGVEETTLDRIDNNGNYCKDNCRRATRKEQAKNRRECRQFDYDGKHFETLRDLANYVGIDENTIRFRLKCGWSLEKAVETKVIDNKISVDYNGKHYKSIGELCSELGLCWEIVYNRLRVGWSIEEAIGKVKKESKHAIEYKGQKFDSLKELATYYKIPYGTVKRRVCQGYKGDELIEGKTIEYKGKKYKTIQEIAKKY